MFMATYEIVGDTPRQMYELAPDLCMRRGVYELKDIETGDRFDWWYVISDLKTPNIKVHGSNVKIFFGTYIHVRSRSRNGF